MSTEAQIGAIALVLLFAAFVHATLSVLSHRLRTQVRKHDIIAGARRRRMEYLDAVAQRAARVSGAKPDEVDMSQFNVDIVEDDEDAPMGQAA